MWVQRVFVSVVSLCQKPSANIGLGAHLTIVHWGHHPVYSTVTVQSKKQYPTISDEKYENRSIRDVPTTKHSFDKLYIIHALN